MVAEWFLRALQHRDDFQSRILKIEPWKSEKAYDKAMKKVAKMDAAKSAAPYLYLTGEAQEEMKAMLEKNSLQFPFTPGLLATEEMWREYLEQYAACMEEYKKEIAYRKYSQNGKREESKESLKKFKRYLIIETLVGAIILITALTMWGLVIYKIFF